MDIALEWNDRIAGKKKEDNGMFSTSNVWFSDGLGKLFQFCINFCNVTISIKNISRAKSSEAGCLTW